MPTTKKLPSKQSRKSAANDPTEAEIAAAKKWTEDHQRWHLGECPLDAYDFLCVVRRDLPPPPPGYTGIWKEFDRQQFLDRFDQWNAALKDEQNPEYLDSVIVSAALLEEFPDMAAGVTEFGPNASGPGPSSTDWLSVQLDYLTQLVTGARQIARVVWTKDQRRDESRNFILTVQDYLVKPILADRVEWICKRISQLREAFRDGAWDCLESDLRQNANRILNDFKRQSRIDARRTESKPASPAIFSHSKDFRSVSKNGEVLTLAPNEAKIVKSLYEAWENGTPDLGNATLLEDIEAPDSSRVKDFFNRRVWKELICTKRKGTYRLNLPPAAPQPRS